MQILSDWESWRRCLFHGKIQDPSPPVQVFMYAPETHQLAKFISFWSDCTMTICNAQNPNQWLTWQLPQWVEARNIPPGRRPHQNMLNHFGTMSLTVTSWNAQYLSRFWRVWHEYVLGVHNDNNGLLSFHSQLWHLLRLRRWNERKNGVTIGWKETRN